jgi:hypothetical protein
MKKPRIPLSITAAHAVGDTVRTFRGEALKVVRVIGGFSYWLNDYETKYPYCEDEIAKPGQMTASEKKLEKFKLRKAGRR